jgi:hypothetical protein
VGASAGSGAASIAQLHSAALRAISVAAVLEVGAVHPISEQQHDMSSITRQRTAYANEGTWPQTKPIRSHVNGLRNRLD